MQKEVKQTWHFNQPPQEVWEYLTKPELIEQWLSKTDFKPIIGYKFQFTNSCEADNGKKHYTFCEVLEIIPQKLLSYSWRKGESEKEITLNSVVTWTLSETKGGTELHLLHTGFTLLKDLLAHTDGWNTCINQFTELLNKNNHANTKA